MKEIISSTNVSFRDKNWQFSEDKNTDYNNKPCIYMKVHMNVVIDGV